MSHKSAFWSAFDFANWSTQYGAFETADRTTNKTSYWATFFTAIDDSFIAAHDGTHRSAVFCAHDETLMSTN